MGNALSPTGGPPDAPNPDPMSPQPGNALSAAGGQPGPSGAGPQQQMPPPPSHQMTVAALRHFDAIEQETKGLLADPDCGKMDMKSKIIDGAAGLVARGIMTPTTAVDQLATVPKSPFDQKQWLEQHLMQAIQSADAVLTHYQMGGPQDDTSAPDPSQHIDMISALQKHYGPSNG